MSGGAFGEGGEPPDWNLEDNSGNTRDSSVASNVTKTSKRGRTKKTQLSIQRKKHNPPPVFKEAVIASVEGQSQQSPIVTPVDQSDLNNNSDTSVNINTCQTNQNKNENVNITNNIKVNEYSNSDNGPFIVYIQTTDLNIGSLHPVVLGKKIILAHPELKTNILNITKMSKKIVKVELKTATAANNMIKQKFTGLDNYNIYIPNHLVTRQGVVRDVDTSLSNEEIMQDIDTDIEILSVDRILKKNDSNNLIPTKSVIIKFKGQNLPNYIYLYRVRFAVSPYVYKVTQCYNCLRYGHSASRCSYPARCKQCAGTHNSR